MDTEIKRMTLGNKVTPVLLLSDEDYKKIEHLFDDEGRPIDSKQLTFGCRSKYAWTLHLNKKYTRSGDRHTMWGISGDSTFGDAPSIFSKRYFGNIRSGTDVFKKFMRRLKANAGQEGLNLTVDMIIAMNKVIQERKPNILNDKDEVLVTMYRELVSYCDSQYRQINLDKRKQGEVQ